MIGTPETLEDDFQVVERRTDVRVVLSVPGRFSLANRRDMVGQRREFPCRIVNLSPHAMAVATTVTGDAGERVIANVDYFGKFEGPIIRSMEGGFVMEIIAPKRDRLRVAAKIEWYERHKNHDVNDQRMHLRIIPRDPYSTLVLADGTTIDCIVQDVSASGIAVLADVIPELRTPVAVGKIVGRVVRHFHDGFAVEFVQVQEADAVESLIGRLS
jgi:hypothetical protein